MHRSNFLWRTLALKTQSKCINSMKISTVLESTSNFLVNWSHRQVMSSNLLSSVCNAPQHHKSTCCHESTIPCQLQCSQWDHNLSCSVLAISEPFINRTKWCPVGPTVLMLSCLRAFGKLTFSMLLENSHKKICLKEKSGRQISPFSDNRQQFNLSPSLHAISPPLQETHLLLEIYLLITICFSRFACVPQYIPPSTFQHFNCLTCNCKCPSMKHAVSGNMETWLIF